MYSLDTILEFQLSGDPTHAALHPSKGTLVTSHGDGTIRVTDFDTNETIRELLICAGDRYRECPL